MWNLEDEEYSYISIPNKDLNDLKDMMLENIMFLKNVYPNIKDENERRTILGKEYLLLSLVLKFSSNKLIPVGGDLRRLMRHYFNIKDNVDYSEIDVNDEQ